MHKAALGAALALLITGAAAAQGNGWGSVSSPAPGPARIIGGTGLGCIAGAVQLPADGPGWQAVRVSRNRHWGHPVLIDWVRDFAGEAQRRGFQDLWIGDLAQPRGGPMTYGHASHQTGIDVDIWLDLSRKPRVPPSAREDIRITSLVLPDESGVDPARFTDGHAALIRLAVERPGVDRVLVNHAIKRELCRRHRGEAWLRLVIQNPLTQEGDVEALADRLEAMALAENPPTTEAAAASVATRLGPGGGGETRR